MEENNSLLNCVILFNFLHVHVRLLVPEFPAGAPASLPALLNNKLLSIQ